LTSSGYAIYFEDIRTITDWLDLQVLIIQENLLFLGQVAVNRLKERGSAVFKTLEEARNALPVVETSLGN